MSSLNSGTDQNILCKVSIELPTQWEQKEAFEAKNE